jgi:hypothetical protein
MAFSAARQQSVCTATTDDLKLRNERRGVIMLAKAVILIVLLIGLPAYAQEHPRSFGPEADRYRGTGDWQREDIDKNYGAGGTYQRKNLKGTRQWQNQWWSSGTGPCYERWWFGWRWRCN